MRIVIIEDEPNSREGLLNIIGRQTGHKVCGVGETGGEGLELVRKKHPDLIISDIRMPEMDGLEMIRKMREEGIETEVILLTGYSEFEYARKALQLQVAEYVLKPVETEKFLETLREAETRIRKKSVEKVSVEQMIWRFLSAGPQEERTILPVLEEKLQVGANMQSSLFLIRPCDMANETLKDMLGETRKLMDMLCMENFYILQIPQERGFLIMMVDTGRNRNLKKIFEDRVLKKLCETFQCVCSMDTVCGLVNFRDTLNGIRDLLKYSFSFPEGSVLDRQTAENIQYETMEYPDNLEQGMIRGIRSGNREKILDFGRKFEEKVIAGNIAPACIREYTLRFSTGILRVAGEIKGDLEREPQIQYVIHKIAMSETKKEVGYQLEKIVHAAARTEENFCISENGMILNVVAFIRENYARDVTLSESASMCGVTPEYLSRIFSQEMGVNFTTFLQNFRVSMAKRMLLFSKCRICEVSEAVGFHDQKYFTKVFKKMSGVTPAEYKRENEG